MNGYFLEVRHRRQPGHRLACALLIGCLMLSVPLTRGQTNAGGGAAATSDFSGKVVETMSSGGYTYVLVETGAGPRWAAAPQFAVKVGDTVAIADGMPMRNHHSKTLNRDFDVVAFTGSVKVNGVAPGAAAQAPGLPKNHPPIAGAETKPTVDLTGLKKAEGGKRISELFADKAKLKGQRVKVRGRVVKYNSEIMGKNWLHIQDGTGSPGSNDLTVTTKTSVKVGDTVLVTGVVVTDRDFGAGYTYSLIIEDAEVKVE